jgi:hypothetical protein
MSQFICDRTFGNLLRSGDHAFTQARQVRIDLQKVQSQYGPATGFVRFWAGLRNVLIKNVLCKGVAIIDGLTTGSCND